jgi:hypothetical protein
MCEKYELKFNELKASVMNEHRTTENDELFAQVPDDDKYGMIAFIYWFLLIISLFEPHSYMQLEILRQIRAFRQSM